MSSLKLNHVLGMGSLAMLLAGCVTTQNAMVLDRVGPDPSSPINTSSNVGNLIVYSAYDANADFDRRDNFRPEYSDYKVLTAASELQQRVHNNSGTILQRPKLVALPPGDYRVVAQANGYGVVTVPVTIVAGKDTILHLEGGTVWPNQPQFNETNAVRLPDGNVVGWKNTMAMK